MILNLSLHYKDFLKLIFSSNIRHKDFRTPSVCDAQGTPRWILKRGGLESSGRRLISSISKTKRIVYMDIYFFCSKEKKNY